MMGNVELNVSTLFKEVNFLKIFTTIKSVYFGKDEKLAE